MKQRAHSLDIRIQKFMQKKINKFPELENQSATGNHGYVWEDILGLFKREGVR